MFQCFTLPVLSLENIVAHAAQHRFTLVLLFSNYKLGKFSTFGVQNNEWHHLRNKSTKINAKMKKIFICILQSLQSFSHFLTFLKLFLIRNQWAEWYQAKKEHNKCRQKTNFKKKKDRY